MKRDDIMATPFRKSLFGFNSDDVTAYITKTHKEHAEQVTVLKEEIENLSDRLKIADSNVKSLASTNAELQAKLKVYTDKYEEIERLAQNIGKLYVVANANAKAIMQSAENNAEVSKNEVNKNLKSVDSIQRTLINTREEINKTASEFSKRLEELLINLSSAKDTISNNDRDTEEKIKEFDALINSIK